METHFQNITEAHHSLARERVLADFRSLVRDSEDLLKATAGDVSDRAKEARRRFAAALDRAKATCEALQQQTLVTAEAAARRTDRVIREHPYESIGVAFGVGLLLGLVFGRK